MTLYKKIPATINKKEHEVRILYDPGLISITVFSDNYPATGFRHQIQISKKLDVEKVLQNLAVSAIIDELIEIAQEDITQRRWERLQEGMKEL